MITVPLKATPSQVVNANLGGQDVTIRVYQKMFGVYADVLLSGALVIGGILCQNLKPLVVNTYFGFIGDLVFYDNQGTTDPFYSGLGSRFILVYVVPSDLA